MGENVRGTGPQVTIPLGQVSDEQVLQELFGESVKVGGVPDFAGNNLVQLVTVISGGTYLFIELHWVAIFGEERGVTSLVVVVSTMNVWAR